MSKIAIKGADTGTGVFTLESPATNTDRTLVLPDEAGTVLTSASSILDVGKVLQIVTASTILRTICNTTSYVGTDLSVTITKQKNDSKVLILTSAFVMAYSASNGDAIGGGRIYETQSSREVFDFRRIVRSYDAADVNVAGATHGLTCVDAVSGTGIRTYRFDIKEFGGSGDIRFNLDSDGDCESTITVLEIAA